MASLERETRQDSGAFVGKEANEKGSGVELCRDRGRKFLRSSQRKVVGV